LIDCSLTNELGIKCDKIVLVIWNANSLEDLRNLYHFLGIHQGQTK
jgi:hypothetical protein